MMNDIHGLDSSTGLRLQIGDLAPNGVELSEEEIRAVSGGRFAVSWTSGAASGADEWVRV
jgi:hypothetical protein